MNYKLEVKYYNSFWLKQATTPLLVDSSGGGAGYFKVFPGFPWITDNDPNVFRSENKADKIYPNWPIPRFSNQPGYFKSNSNNSPNGNYNRASGSNWVIEESRIKGAFNGNTVDLGVRAYLREDSNLAKKRNNALIYSGIFNSNTNVNNTNVFSIAEDITKAVDPHNGSIQLIYAMDNNLTIFQENKVSTALIDKDAIYSAEGSPMTTQSDVVIGQVTPYNGEYGISRNPESFALFGFRRYFSDKNRGCILRLSRDGITEISNYGMRDFFRDEMANVSDLNTEYRSSDYQLSLTFRSSSTLASNSSLNDSELGDYIVLNSTISQDDSINGCLLEINKSYPSGNWIKLDAKATTTGARTNNLTGIKETLVFLNKSINIQPTNGGTGEVYVRFMHVKHDAIKGGFDNYKDNYLLSIQKHSGSKTNDEASDNYNTLSFDEISQGWTTFYTFRPGLIFSLKNNFYTTKENEVYKHYGSTDNHNSFYGAEPVASSIEFVFNGNPSINKNFKTISYEGSNGWQVESFRSDFTDNTNSSLSDTTNGVRSYEEGVYIEKGVSYRVGFDRKNNKYVARLINASQAKNGEVNFGSSITGIKGFFGVVKLSTDATTNVGKMKELFAVSTDFVTHNL